MKNIRQIMEYLMDYITRFPTREYLEKLAVLFKIKA